MTNDEIDLRLKKLADCLPQHAKRLYGCIDGDRNDAPLKEIRAELELHNASMIGIFAMLGEIAKRLPEAKL